MNLKNIILFLSIGLLVLSCTDDFEEINTDPDKPTTTDPNYIFNYVAKEGAGYFGMDNDYFNRRNFQYWIMHTSPFGNSTMPPYEMLTQDHIKSIWAYFYTNLGSNCQYLVNMTSENPDDDTKHQIATIWKVFNFHKATDLWGDVPYSEAWQLLDGFTPEASRPKYDTQEDIYNSFLADLKSAADAIEADPKEAFQNDEIYNGNTDLWIKFANSLRLRLAVRSGNNSVVSEIITEDNLISDNTESATYDYLDSKDWWNPYYDAEINSKNPINPDAIGTAVPKISRLMELQLKNTNDPRLQIFATPTELNDTLYVGVPNLMDVNKKEQQALRLQKTNTSYIGARYYTNPSITKPLLTYSEVCFLRAEAAQRNWTTEDAQTWFENGIRSSMEFYGVAEDDIVDFIAANPYDNTIKQIIEQKWVSLFLDGWEAFSEYRRTGYPQLMKWDMVLDGTQIIDTTWVEVPREYVAGRVPYPENELNFNEVNYVDAVSRIGEDTFHKQVWFSKQFGEVNY